MKDDVMEKMVEAACLAFWGNDSIDESDFTCMRQVVEAVLAHCPAQGGAVPDVARLRKALEPFARVARSIPPDLPDDLWTECESYPTVLTDEQVKALEDRGVKLESRESQLLLWIDSITIGMFRGAADALLTADPSPPIRDAEIERLTAEVARLRAALVEIEAGGWKEGLGVEHAVAAHYAVRKIARRAIEQTMDT